MRRLCLLLLSCIAFFGPCASQESELDNQANCYDPEFFEMSFFKSYGGLYGEQGNVVRQLDDGTVATGMQLTPIGGGVVYPGLLLCDAAGEKIFCKKYPDIPSPSAVQHMIVNEEGFLLAGVNWIMQTDSLGDVIWSKRLSIGTSAAITDILQVPEGYVITGFSRPNTVGYPEIFCSLISSQGDIIWSNQIESGNYQLRNIRLQKSANGYFLAGTGKFSTIFLSAFLLELDSLGNPIWSKYYDTFYDDELMELTMDEQGHLYLIGRNYNIDSEWNIFALKLDSTGTIMETLHLDNDNSDQSARCATMVGEDDLAISFDHGNGNSRSPAVVSISLEDLSINWCKSYPYETQFTNYVLDITATQNNGLLMVGDMHVIGKIRDTYLIQTLPNGDAGCNSLDYPLSPIEYPFTESDMPVFSVDVETLLNDISVEAQDDFTVVEFLVCEDIPPCADFHYLLTSEIECEQACYEFQEASSFSPTEWEWTFENGTPSTYLGQFPPEVCWTEEGDHQVQLSVSSEGGEHSRTEIVHIDFNCPPIIPNVFTPNDDGKNDEFIIQYLPREFHLTIFNRWGQPLFETEDPQKNWDGRNSNSGKNASEGVYFYELQDHIDDIRYAGHLQLLR